MAALQSCCWLQLGWEPHMLLAEPKSGAWEGVWGHLGSEAGADSALGQGESLLRRGATPAWYQQDPSLPPSLPHIFSRLTNLKRS